jgi:rSAM/selenodomain-associated transferase 1
MMPALAVLLEAPRLGAVKPRLAAEIGPRQALRLYRVLANRTLAAARAAGLDPTIWFSPADAGAEMRFWLGDQWDLRPQASGDLGARLAAAEHAVERGRGWLSVTADCPRLDATLLRDAAAMVARDEIVLGPGECGDYYLVGGRAPLPPLFTAIPWGTDAVLTELRARLTRARVGWHELPTLRVVENGVDARAEGLLT